MTETETDGNGQIVSTDKQVGEAIVRNERTDNGVAAPTTQTVGSELVPAERDRTDDLEADPVPGVCDVLVAIPAYNEETTIGGIVEQASRYADQVVVVDDGSDDDTAVRATGAGAIVIEHERNRGYGAALKTAFEVAQRYSVRHLVVLDGDGQHDPADIPRFVAAQERTDAHLVIGSRFIAGATSNAPMYRRLGLRMINILTNLSFRVFHVASRVSDTQSGFRAYDQEAIETLAADLTIGDRMEASTDILYHAYHNDYIIEEIAIAVEYDVANASSQEPLSHGVDLVGNILQTIGREHPVAILAVPGIGLTGIGVSVGYWSLIARTAPVGLGLVSLFLVVIGLSVCLTGFTTSVSNTMQRGKQ